MKYLKITKKRNLKKNHYQILKAEQASKHERGEVLLLFSLLISLPLLCYRLTTIMPAPRCTTQHHAAPRSTTQHHAVPRSTCLHLLILSSKNSAVDVKAPPWVPQKEGELKKQGIFFLHSLPTVLFLLFLSFLPRLLI